MTCHSQIWTNAKILAPVRQSYALDVPLHWNRVYRVPKFVYFDHSIHIAKGIGCSSCHGPVDRMPLMRKARTFYMRDCLECHRDPEKYVRPRDQIFNLSWTPPATQNVEGVRLVKQYSIRKERIMDCNTCHR
jgi:hypothetical protein